FRDSRLTIARGPAKVPGITGGGTFRTTARLLPEAAGCGARPEPRKCRLRTSKRNFAGREALACPQTASVTLGEHPPGGRPGHSVHNADYAPGSVTTSWLQPAHRSPGSVLARSALLAGCGVSRLRHRRSDRDSRPDDPAARRGDPPN